VSIYFLNATFATAFVVRRCAGYKVEATEGPQIRSKSLSRVSVSTDVARSSASQSRPDRYSSNILGVIPRGAPPIGHVGRQGRFGLRPCLCKLINAPFRDLMFAER
jgi:hypothetical protein